LERFTHLLQQVRRFAEKRDSDLMGTATHRHADLELLGRHRPGARSWPDGEQLQLLSVDRDFELVRVRCSASSAQLDFDLVLCIARKQVRDVGPAASAERQSLHAVVLLQLG
jgi:hypothetical protein